VFYPPRIDSLSVSPASRDNNDDPGLIQEIQIFREFTNLSGVLIRED
jgi:hypothetical protein